MFERTLFPTDGTDGANTAFERVLDVTKEYEATLHVLDIPDTDRLEPDIGYHPGTPFSLEQREGISI